MCSSKIYQGSFLPFALNLVFTITLYFIHLWSSFVTRELTRYLGKVDHHLGWAHKYQYKEYADILYDITWIYFFIKSVVD
jgi:hypothetical protein